MKRLLKSQTRRFFRTLLHPIVIYLTVVGNSILLLATFIVYELEKGQNPQFTSYFDSLWWGVYTITTVGYGDILPATFLGRLIGIFLMYTGSVLFISFTGAILTNLMKEEVSRELDPLEREVRQGEKEQAKIEKTLETILDRLDAIESKMQK